MLSLANYGSLVGPRCATGPHARRPYRFVLTFATEDEVDRSICKSRADRERVVRDRRAEPGARGREYFPQASSIAGEPRRADGIPDHFHRLRVAVLTYFHDSLGIVDGDPARVRTALRGQ